MGFCPMLDKFTPHFIVTAQKSGQYIVSDERLLYGFQHGG